MIDNEDSFAIFQVKRSKKIKKDRAIKLEQVYHYQHWKHYELLHEMQQKASAQEQTIVTLIESNLASYSNNQQIVDWRTSFIESHQSLVCRNESETFEDSPQFFNFGMERHIY